MNEESLSILIVSYDCWRYLDTCLQSIGNSQYPLSEIIVVDNASMDGTGERVRSCYPRVRLVPNDKNVGHARAVNQGFELARGGRVLLLDADTELMPDAIGILMEYLDEHPAVSMVAPRTLNSDGTVQESARCFPSAANGLFGRQSILTALFPNNRFSGRYLLRDHAGARSPFRVEQVSSACMLFRRTVLETAGWWDEGFRGYWVDTEWCKRVQRAGGVIFCVPRATVIHHDQNRRSRKKNPRRIIDFHRGAYRFYHLHYTRGRWDPRSLLAALFLTVRTVLLITTNMCKRNA